MADQDLKVRYVVDVVDKGAKQLLVTDRQIRAGLDKTTSSLARQTRASDLLAKGQGKVAAASRQQEIAARELRSGLSAIERAYSGLNGQQSEYVREAGRVAAANREIERSARDAERATSRIGRGGPTPGAGKGTSAFTAARELGGGARGLGGGIAAAGAGALARGAGVVGVVGGALAGAGALKSIISEYDEAARVGAQTNAVLKSTGGVAHVSAKQVGDLANALSLKTGIDDEAIQSGQNMLLTFTNIRNETGRGNKVFDEATKVVTDMSVAMGGDMSKAAIQVGKALNDPIKGVGALGKVGVTFTKDQKAQIKTLVDSGKQLDAQKIILRELNKEFGGSAEAQAQPIDKLKTAYGNLAEEIGGLAAPTVTKGIDALTSFTRSLGDADGLGGKIAGNVKGLVSGLSGGARQRGSSSDGANANAPAPTAAQQVGGRVRELALGAQALGKQALPYLTTFAKGAVSAGKQLLAAFAPATPFLRNVLLPLVKGIAIGVGGTLLSAFKVIVPAIRITAGVLGAIGNAAKPLKGVITGVGVALGFLGGGPLLKLVDKGGKVAGLLSRLGGESGLFPRLGKAVSIATTPIRLQISAVEKVAGALGRLGGIVGSVGKAIGGRFSSAFNELKVLVAGIPGVVGSVASAALKAAGRVGGAIVSGIGKVAGAPGRVASAVGQIPSRLGGLVGRIASSAAGIGKAIVSGIVDGIKSAPGIVIDAVKSLVPGPLRKVVDGFRGGGRVNRYKDGGLVPAMVSPGEMLIGPGGAAAMVPGPRVAADNVFTMLPAGTAVVTGHGQHMLAAGASLDETMRRQLPHFAKGGIAGASMYGGPGDPTTRKPERGYRGDLLERYPDTFAELGANGGIGNALGGLPYKTPLTITYRGRSLTVRKRDIGRGGGPVDGHARTIDLYYRAAQKLGFSGLGVVNYAAGTDLPGGTLAAAAGAAKTRYKITREYGERPGDAFNTGYEAGLGGASRVGGSFLAQAARSAYATITKEKITSSSSRSSASRAAARGASTTGTDGLTWRRGQPTIPWATAFAKHYGLRISSSYRTPAHNAAVGGVPNSDHTHGSPSNPGAFDFVPPNQTALLKAKTFARQALIHNAGSGLHLHVGLFRKGGYAAGETAAQRGLAAVGNAPNRRGAITAAARQLATALADTDRITETRVLQIARTLRTTIKQVGRTSQAGHRALAALDIATAEVGRRIGATVARADMLGAGVTQRAGNLSYFQRSQGIDPQSSAGLKMSLAAAADDRTDLKKQATLYTSAIKRARRAGQTEKAKELEDALKGVNDQITESVLQTAEQTRALIVAKAGENVSAAQFKVDSANAGLAFLDAAQRVNGTAGSSQGMLARAGALQAIAPQLAELAQRQRDQAGAFLRTGDVAGFQQALLQAAATTTDLANAQADAAELIRDAGRQQAQDVYDTADFTRQLDELGLTALQSRQQIAGTAGTAGAQEELRQYITQTIIPDIDRQIAAKQAQLTALQAETTPDARLIRQTLLEVAGLQNEKLSEIAEATSQTADNTETLKEFSGSTAFDFGNQLFTDITNAGVGA